jgi:2-hydroxychromene-2-carboxylate isomerase
MAIPSAWYFDFVSPFAYLQFARLRPLARELDIALKPILFSALLKHWGHKGPAEIPSKRRFVYRFFKWSADRRSIPFVMPPVHPFNSLPLLRLALAAGAEMETVGLIFHHVYGEGNETEGVEAIAAVARKLGIGDVEARLSDQNVKDTLRLNTELAIAQGVFGVPTFVVGGELFWGDDATDMLQDYLRDPALFTKGDYTRLSSMPMGVIRKN